jgi:hypothetical protein
VQLTGSGNRIQDRSPAGKGSGQATPSGGRLQPRSLLAAAF